MADIIAVKTVNGKELKQRFSEYSWKLLGPDKNGWKERQAAQVVTQAKQKPSTGQKVENLLKDEDKSGQIVDDVSKKADEQIVSDTSEKVSKKEAEFMNHIKGFNKTIIKDFFDEHDPKIEYDNSAKIDDLKKQLAKFFKYDILKLQEEFNA